MRTTLVLIMHVLVLCEAPATDASTAIDARYERVGLPENLTASFQVASTQTANTYGRFVEILVSGTGISFYQEINDAFYDVDLQTQQEAGFFQLNVGWMSAPLVPGVGEPRNAANYITFIEGVGDVDPPTFPPYRPDHVYHFVLELPLADSLLQFGVSDGNFSDNSGEYQITLWPLEDRLYPKGDFNLDSVVDAADFTVWRDSFGSIVAPYALGDANGDGFVQQLDYESWRANFGQSGQVGQSVFAGTVPEPASWGLAAVAACGFLLCTRGSDA